MLLEGANCSAINKTTSQLRIQIFKPSLWLEPTVTQADALLFDKKHLQMTSSAQSVVVVAMYYYTPNTFNPMITRILQFCMMRESSGKILAENCTLKSWILNHRLYKIMTTFPNACKVSTSACRMIKLPPGAVMMAVTIRSTKSSTCSKLWAFPSKSCKNSQASHGDPSCKCIMKSVCPTSEQPCSWSVSLSHSLCNKNHGVTNSSTAFSLLEVKEIKDIISEKMQLFFFHYNINLALFAMYKQANPREHCHCFQHSRRRVYCCIEARAVMLRIDRHFGEYS
jgi:hypothetical protein